MIPSTHLHFADVWRFLIIHVLQKKLSYRKNRKGNENHGRKKEKRPDFNLLHTKLIANGLTFDERKKVFTKMSTNHITYFYLLNGEAEKDLSAETPIAMLTFLLPLKGQNNILKVFENMIALARNLATSFEMKLLDDDFNPVSDQTVANYKERAAELDINLGNNVARRRIK